MTISSPTDTHLLLERVFDAPRELVWDAWTKPENIAQWWAPNGWTTEVKTMEVTPGGTWLYGMTAGKELDSIAGMESWGITTYDEVVKPERLVYTDRFCDAQGTLTPGMPEIKVILEFIDHDGKTMLRSLSTFASAEDLAKLKQMGMEQGLTESWNSLERFLSLSN